MATRPLIPIEQVGAPRARSGGVPQKWELGDRERRLILDLYDGTPARTDMIQRYLPGVPRKTIREWGRMLGKAKPRGVWTEEQEQYLRENFGKVSFHQLEIHLKKDRLSILRKIEQLRLRKEDNDDGYTLTDLMAGLGTNNYHTVRRWVDKGWLKGTKRKIGSNEEVWNFSAKAIREFIFAHPQEVDPHKFDWLWIIDILAGDNGIGALDTQRSR